MTGELFHDAVAGPGADYVQVAPERGIDLADGLTYAIPASMRDIAVGERVLVPLGRGGKPSAGVVVRVGVEPPRGGITVKKISQRTGVRLTPSLVDLGRWMASYYCCPLGMTLSAMVPAAVKRQVGRIRRTLVERTGAEPIAKPPKATNAAWEAIRILEPKTFPIDARELAARVGASNVGPINRLVEIGALREVERETVRASWLLPQAEPSAAPPLTPDQRRVTGAIGAALDAFGVHLLRGVTGSGKTEVYLDLLERVVRQGRSAIVLVPEISLTPQAVARFTGRLGGRRVAVLHSGLTKAQRNQQWSAIARGDASVALGARSAIFAPFPEDDQSAARLGLIVVDEEHESAYKQEDQPRYHARDVAIRRAQTSGCPIVLGSATPSLESWRNAVKNRFALHELPTRIGGAQMPVVRIVDLREEMQREPDRRMRDALLGPTLRREMRAALDDGSQIILLLNRRGFASHIRCADHRCGWVRECDSCDAPMVVHRGRDLAPGGIIRCHHCLAEQRIPKRCEVCGKGVILLGVGSQRIEAELPALFPELVDGESLVRMDSDTMHGARDYHNVVDRFAKGAIRVLLGTQMLGKGHDFPGVGLVGVISADTGLAIPDFRAAERTFQLVSQVAGRAGRTKERPGRVVVQTVHPQQPAIVLAAAHDYVRFATEELRIRERAMLPPATRLARIICRDEERERAEAAATKVADFLRGLVRAGAPIRVDGPAPCALQRLSDRYRWGVEVRAEDPGALQRCLTEARNAGFAHSDRHMAIDVDPVSVL